MTISLLRSPRFVEDYKKLQQRIESIQSENIKNELYVLLKELRNQVGYIDRCHEQMMISGKIYSELSEIREELSRVRKSLENKLSLHEKH